MKEEQKEKHFNPKAHILTLLGNELIKNPVMAIYELVKNSYDADAKKVDVFFENIEDIDKSAIIIEDDGIGMTSEIIEDVWLEPGSDFRKPIDPISGLRKIVKSPLFDRIPMGEKGVGRFAVHKLASKILLISRPLIITFDKESNEITSKVLSEYEIELYLDWNQFSQSKHLSDVPIQWKIKSDKEHFRHKLDHGTYIRLSGLKENWTKGMARELKGQILSMLSPKIKENTFKINLNFNNQWLVDFPSIDKIINEAPYKLTSFIDEKFNLTFEYDFSLKNNKGIGIRSIRDDKKYDKNIKGNIKSELKLFLTKKEHDKDTIENILNHFDSQNLPFGSVYIELYSYDLDSSSLKDYTDDPTLLKKILRDQSGIKIFKGDLRVYDYGEKGNDWLGIDLERVNNKTWFSNNQNIGFIYLDPENSGELIEKTNREGFIHNYAYDLFFILIRYILIEFKSDRYSDRSRWLKLNQKSSNKLFEDKINNFRSLIEESEIKNPDQKLKLIEEAEKLEEKYEEDKKILLIPAGVGMTASIALHEIEKLVPRMEETVKSEPLKQTLIREQVNELKQYTEGIISVLRKGGDKPMDVREAVARSFYNYEYKLSDRKIEYQIDIAEDVNTINCDKRFFITILMNLIDNSIYWLDTIYKKEKIIYLKAFKKGIETIIIVADNGPGFKDHISDLIKPFFSRKSDGIGIGLYLIDTIMMKYGKFDIIIDNTEIESLDIPTNIDGAITKLIFSKNQ